MNLRDYQLKAVDLVFEAWKEHQSTLLVLPTGCGKTICFSEIIKRMHPKRALVIAHREELIWQARNKIEGHAGLDCEIEMADMRASTTFWSQMPVVVSTIQTQTSGNGGKGRMDRFNPLDFGLVVVDECFPAGTLVDGRRIEELKLTDRVRTHKGIGSITHLFKHIPSALCRLSFSDGKTIVCTPKHPIWTQDGFKSACDLLCSDVVLTIMPYEKMCHLLGSSHQQTLRQEGMQVGIKSQDNSRILQEAWRGNNEVQKNKRNASSRCEGIGVLEIEGDGVEAYSEDGKRPWSNNPATGVGFSAGMGHGSGNTHPSKERQWLSDLLQGGHWKYSSEGSGGGRWKLSLSSGQKSAGCEKDFPAEFTRLVSRENIKQTSDGKFGGMCPDGFVYNLEVSNGNTYFANGVLVHNCHHATASTYRKMLDFYKQNPNLKILGVTATPDRSDEEALGQIFESVAFDYEILDAINGGYLVPIHQQMVTIEGLDFSSVRTTAGDLNGADLASVMEAEKNMQGVAAASLDIIGEKRTLAFTASVKQAEMLSEIFNRHRPDMSGWVCGKTPKDQRRELLKQFGYGQIQVVVNCGVLTEGFDEVSIQCIVQARPTKSRALYSQMVGRGTRPLAGVIDNLDTAEARKSAIAASAKPTMMVVDFVGNAGRHKLMTTADILGGNFTDEEIALAEKIVKKKGGAVDMTEELEDVREMLEEKRRQEAAKRAKLVAKATYVAQTVNPFNVFDMEPVVERGWDRGKVLTEKQTALLRKQGFDPSTMSYAAATKLIQEFVRRWQGKLCTYKQAKLLQKHGYDVKDLPMAEASKLIDALAKNNWKRPSEPAPREDARIINQTEETVEEPF